MIGILPLGQLALWSALAILVRRLVMRSTAMPASAGSAVMAIGIFGLAALQQMPAMTAQVTQPLAIGLLVIWGCIAWSYITFGREGLRRYARPPIGRFALGTWVAATAVLLRMVLLGVPEWRPLALLLGLLALAIWLWFLTLVASGLRALANASFRELTPGVVLLSTISTQSLALAALDLFPGRPMIESAAAALTGVGGMFYLAGVVLILRSHFRAADWTLKDDWDNTNCTLHGAISITGLAVVAWDFGPDALALTLWLCALAVFIAVEGVELARLWTRVRAYGWRRGAFSYRVSQWSRNFTFGMLYAFTLALSQRVDLSAQRSSLRAAAESILTFGPYVVLFLLLLEVMLFFDDRRAPREPRSPG